MSPIVKKSKRATTLSDVAKAAGVSVATASYVLSNREGVTISEPTRQRVHEVAASLNYRRNALAAALRTGAARSVGVVLARKPTGVLSEIAFSCVEVAVARGLIASMSLSMESFDPTTVEGVILIGGVTGLLHPRLLDGSMPVVEIGGSSTGCQVHADDFGGARRAVEYLLSLGHRRIAHLAGPQSQPAFQERLRGFLDAVHEGGLRMDASPVIHSETDLVDMLHSVQRPTALLAFDDRGALLAMRLCREMGLNVPHDLSIVGFDDEPFSALVDPPLTTLRITPELLVGSAFELLERQFSGLPMPSQTLVPTTLVTRASTAPR